MHGILWNKTLLSKPLLALETYAPPKHPLEATLGAAGGPARLLDTRLEQQLHAVGAAVLCGPVERRVTSALWAEAPRASNPSVFPGTGWSREKDPNKLEAACMRRDITAVAAPRILHNAA